MIAASVNNIYECIFYSVSVMSLAACIIAMFKWA